MTLTEKRMEKLNRLYKKCRANMEKIGIEAGDVLRLEILGKNDGAVGYCIKEDDGFVIQISNMFLDDCPDEIAETTIYHELIHTIPGCYGHGDKFSSIAENIHKEYHTINDLINDPTPADNGYIIENAKWAYRCGSCGWTRVRTGTKGPKKKSGGICPHCSHGSFLRPITGDAFERLKKETNEKYFKNHTKNEKVIN